MILSKLAAGVQTGDLGRGVMAICRDRSRSPFGQPRGLRLQFFAKLNRRSYLFGAADVVDDVRGVSWDGVAAPGDMAVGANQYQAALVGFFHFRFVQRDDV